MSARVRCWLASWRLRRAVEAELRILRADAIVRRDYDVPRFWWQHQDGH